MGGFVNKDEDATHACIREVKEEVGLDLPVNKVEQLMTVSTPCLLYTSNEPREERVETSNAGDQGKEEKTVNEPQEESEQPSAATSEKENRTVSQGTEASQPATSLNEETEIADYGPLPSTVSYTHLNSSFLQRIG